MRIPPIDQAILEASAIVEAEACGATQERERLRALAERMVADPHGHFAIPRELRRKDLAVLGLRAFLGRIES